MSGESSRINGDASTRFVEDYETGGLIELVACLCTEWLSECHDSHGGIEVGPGVGTVLCPVQSLETPHSIGRQAI